VADADRRVRGRERATGRLLQEREGRSQGEPARPLASTACSIYLALIRIVSGVRAAVCRARHNRFTANAASWSGWCMVMGSWLRATACGSRITRQALSADLHDLKAATSGY
jgi:hypothetical protein